MARNIFLVRHGKPVLPGNGHCCIGDKTDVGLSTEGIAQANRLIPCFRHFQFIYCSGMERSQQSAEIIADGHATVCTVEGMDEMDVGEWEGMFFSDIREVHRKTYMERGVDWSIPPDGGESLENAANRSHQALLDILAKTEGDISLITHDGVIRALLWRLQHLDTRVTVMPRQAYGSITVLRFEYGALSVCAVGRLPEEAPTEEEILEIWDECGLPEAVRNHSMVVDDKCHEMWELLKEKGIVTSQNLLYAAALLHDVCSLMGVNHGVYAARLLQERGYLNLANIIEDHSNGCVHEGIDEAQILYLADKVTLGTRTVGLEEYLEKLAGKCQTTEENEINNMKLKKALAIKRKIEGALGMEICR